MMYRMILLAIIGCVLLSGGTASQSLGNEPSSALSIEVEPVQRRTLLGIPFLVRTTLKNTGSETFNISSLVDDLGARFLGYTLTNEKGEKIGYRPWSGPPFVVFPDGYRGIELKPGARYVILQDLSYQGSTEEREGGVTLNAPGTYTLSATYKCDDTSEYDCDGIALSRITAVSPPVKVTVVAPTGRTLEAYEAFTNPPKTDINDHAGREQFYRTFLDRYPKSPYAQYIHMYLTGTLSDYADETNKPEDYERVILEYRKILKLYKPMVFEEHIRVSLATSLAKAGRKTEAHDAYEELLADPSVSDTKKRLVKALIRNLNKKT